VDQEGIQRHLKIMNTKDSGRTISRMDAVIKYLRMTAPIEEVLSKELKKGMGTMCPLREFIWDIF
jgi:hypothetical protein